MFGFFIFNAIRRVTSEQTAGQVANFIMTRIPRNRLTYRLTDVASYWLDRETSFQNCQHCFGFVVKAKDPYIHDECEAPFREDYERFEQVEREADEWARDHQELIRLDAERIQAELDWERFKAEEEVVTNAYYAELDQETEDEDGCERCGLKYCNGPCNECGECSQCVCAELESLRRYNATPLEERCGPWTA